MSEDLKSLLKDYGPAIGPGLAFLLGLVALFAKHRFDEWSAEDAVKRKLERLQELLVRSRPPWHFFPNSSEQFLHADEARNLTNISRFYGKALAVQAVAKQIEEKVHEHCSYPDVLRLSALQWSLGFLIKELEEFRSNSEKLTPFMLTSLRDRWIQIENDFSREAAGFDYIEGKRDVERII